MSSAASAGASMRGRGHSHSHSHSHSQARAGPSQLSSDNAAVAASVSAALRKAILRIFTRKHGLHLHASSLPFIQSSLAAHDLLDKPEEWTEALEALAKGVDEVSDMHLHMAATATAAQPSSSSSSASFSSSVVTPEILEAVYERLVLADSVTDASNAAHHAHTTMNGNGAHDLVAGEVADPQRHFHIIDAFQMPRWSWSHSRWEKQAKGTLLPPATAKPMHLAQRLAIIRSAVERNSNFMPPLAIGGAVERQRFMKLTSTKNLLGRPGQRFLLFGMLSTTEDGRYALEDADGVVGLDLQDAVPGEGIFTEGSFILVEGEYTQEERIRAAAIGHPPGESRKAARKLWSDTDFNGTGAISLNEESLLKVHEERNDDVCMIFISEFHLDHQKTMASFRAMLQGFVDAQFIPFAFVLCGNFLSAPHQGGDTVRLYQDAFAQLGDLLLSYPSILTRSRFIFVPGPSDPFTTPLLPRPALPQIITSKLLSKIASSNSGAVASSANRFRFVSNPARLQYFGQEIVVCRDDLMSRMLRNTVRLKDGERGAREVDLKKYLVSTILDQAHLCPLPQQSRPVLWEHDHALRLYPMPTALVLADKFDRYELTYEGCHVFNPSSFRGSSFGWTTYYPATGRAERSELPRA